jgi:transcriptional antiterminator NusG
MEMTDKMWHFMRMLPGAQGFIGGTRDKPMPVSTREVMNILKRLEPSSAVRQHVNALFEAGDSVKVIDGPFADFNGVVEEVMPEKSRLMVSVLIFGRSTPVELDFTQVEKVG